jgi:uncharacterized DUF497 family protein
MPPARLRFESAPRKEAANLLKHGISFQEAASVFLSDENAYSDFDEDHSVDDYRFFTIGISAAGTFLFTLHDAEDGVIRLISARHASSRESSLYEES